jgi:hypothetical protein
MKKTTAILTLILSFGAFAQERVQLDSKKVSVAAAEAIVVRTNQTPKKVKISFVVPMANSTCVRYETRYVYRTSGMHCGYDYRYRRVRGPSICVQRDSKGRCTRYQQTWREQRYQYPRSCMVPESYCAQYGTSTSYDNDSMIIKFKDLPALADSESETFRISAKQRSRGTLDVVYEVKPLKTLREYKVTQKNILGMERDRFVVQEK